MDTRLPAFRDLRAALTFVLVCLVATLLFWRAVGGDTPLEPKGYGLTVPLQSAPNLFAGSDVRISGLTVGEVREVRREGARAVAEVRIDAKYAPLPAGTTATLRSKTLLGEGYLALRPGPGAAPKLPDGGALRGSDVRTTERLDDVIGTLDAPTRRRVKSLFKDLAGATRGRGQTLSTTIATLDPATSGLTETLRVLDSQSDDLARLVRDGGTTVAALGRRQGALRQAIKSADAVFATTARSDRELRATLRSLPPFLAQLRTTANVLERADADLRPAARAVVALAPAVGPALAELRRTAPEADRLFKAVRRDVPAIRRGLPGLERVLLRAGPALEGLHPSLREIQPVLELLTTVRDAAVTTFAGVGQIHNGTFVAENNRVQHFANGIITVWNESIGGWVKRLPSNRGNTYPKPGFLDNIRTGLESFDCRHLRNVPYVPPLGGTPPCKEQGPWTYDGKSRFYPTLEPAPP